MYSFHSISFPSEWGGRRRFEGFPRGVSIQLVSPASGESSSPSAIARSTLRFHSISFPSEWGESHFKLLPGKISRADFRSSDIL